MKKLSQVTTAIIVLLFTVGSAQATTAKCWVRTDSANTTVYDGVDNVYQPLRDNLPGPNGTLVHPKDGRVSNVTGTPSEESSSTITRTIHIDFDPPLNSTERNKLYFDMKVGASGPNALNSLSTVLNRTQSIDNTTPQLKGNNCYEADKLQYYISPDGSAMVLTAYYHQRQVIRSDCQEIAWDQGANRLFLYFQRNPQVGGQTEPGFACSVMVDQPEFTP